MYFGPLVKDECSRECSSNSTVYSLYVTHRNTKTEIVLDNLPVNVAKHSTSTSQTLN